MTLNARPLAFTGLLLAVTTASWAQGAAPAPAPQPAPASVPGTAPPEPYSYSPEGRRDPFVNLLARGADSPTGKRNDGLSGLSTDDLRVRGVLNNGGTYIALISGPDGKTYSVHVNDHIADGTIRSITAQGLVVMQQVNDPLSRSKQREVHKGFKTVDDGK